MTQEEIRRLVLLELQVSHLRGALLDIIEYCSDHKAWELDYIYDIAIEAIND